MTSAHSRTPEGRARDPLYARGWGMLMKKLLAAILTAAMSLTTAGASRADDKAGAGAPLNEAPTTKKVIGGVFVGVSFGQSPKQVAAAIDKILDEDYRPLLHKAGPGPGLKELEARAAADKARFRLSVIDFGPLPGGIDSTPLRFEYTYQNGEAMMQLTRGGQLTSFFFIQDRLWKVIQEQTLGPDSLLGKNLPEALAKLETRFDVAGRVLPPNTVRAALEVDWKDATTHFRAIARGPTTAAFAYEDNSTVANLATLRPHRPAPASAPDPAPAPAPAHGSH